MKSIIAQDSERLIVMDEKVRHRGLFSYYLPRLVLSIILSGITTYGFLHAILHPKVISFFEHLDNIDPIYVLGFVILGLAMFTIWALVIRRK